MLHPLARVFVASAAAVTLPVAGAGPAGAQEEMVRPTGRQCASVQPGLTTVDVASAGVAYPVTLYVPHGYTGHQAVPLVLNLHGSGSNGTNQLIISDMQRAADEHGFLVAAPNGGVAYPDSPGGYTWVLPGVPNTSGQLPSPGDRDDVKFISDTISTISNGFCVDTGRVYATGFSGGARMASLLACELSDRIAAIAPVGGLRAGVPDADNPDLPQAGSCTPARPVPVLAFHGQEDEVNPYSGGGPRYWKYSVPTAFGRWADLNECRIGPYQRQVAEHVALKTYRACRQDADVSLYAIGDGGHTWPGSPYPGAFPGMGKVSDEVNATDVMWKFFAQHKLPTPSSNASSVPLSQRP